IRRRVFAAPRGAVRSDDAAAGPVAAPDGQPFHVDRRSEALVERFEDVSMEVARPRFDTPLAFAAGQGEAVFPGAVRTLSELAGPGRFGLDLSGGLVDAQVRVEVSRGRTIEDWLVRLLGMPLVLRAHLAVLTDSWTASGPYGPASDSVQRRVEAGARVPLAETAIDAAWLPARALLEAGGLIGLEPTARTMRRHAIDVDLVPPDRLAAAAVPAPTPEPSAPDWNGF
ncbi:MAG TPA: hypothetical protein VEA81_11445, partial [Burkholderiaceae bacterium]|nr:hypothetical protein [Burkholderiaceae bacterium]